jgi:hypothetical protein
VIEVSLFIEEAGEDNKGRHGVEYREHPDSDHQLLQFVCLGTVVFHDSTDTKERDKPGQQEYRAQNQVDEQRGQDETSESVHVPQADVADPTQNVACNKNKKKMFILA